MSTVSSVMVTAVVAAAGGIILAPAWSMAREPSGRASGGAGLRLPATWQYTAPLILPEERPTNRSVAQKDPTIVFVKGKWHVFMTIKLKGVSPIEYCSFDKWENAHEAPRTILKIADSKYYCAPQVFYFAPQKKWYLIYQVGVPGKKRMWIAFSTTSDLADP
ncbi:unnamed protein product, partial [marine sediment metagenome]